MLKTLLKNGKKYLVEHSTFENKSYSLDAELLLMHVMDISRSDLLLKDFDTVTMSDIGQYMSMIKKRANGMPVQYLTGSCEFMSLDFIVTNDTLIPRPDTEILVETVISYINKNFKDADKVNIIEIGTGTGCISISVAKYCENVFIKAVDISDNALAVAKKNAKLNNVTNRVEFIESNLFENLSDLDKASIDIIVSNPPYIRTEDIETLGKNVRNYEPLLALDGKSDGLFFYRKIAEQSIPFLRENGMLIFEIGYDQKKEVSDIMNINGFSNVKCLKDLAGHNRVLYGFR